MVPILSCTARDQPRQYSSIQLSGKPTTSACAAYRELTSVDLPHPTQYMLDPKVAGLVSRELEAESIVAFDEAHNIDNVCTEALSVQLDRRSLEAASGCIARIKSRVEEMKSSDQQRLTDEYQRLVRGLANVGQFGGSDADNVLANPALPADILQEAVPGNIRKAEHFIGFLAKVSDV